jgi:hypothetical protein
MFLKLYENIIFNNIYKYFVLTYFILFYFYINWNEEKLIIFIIIFCLYIFTFNFSFILSDLYINHITNILYKFNQNNFMHQENLFNLITYLNNFKIYFQLSFKTQINKFFVLMYLIIFNNKILNYYINKKYFIINFLFIYTFYNRYYLKFFSI